MGQVAAESHDGFIFPCIWPTVPTTQDHKGSLSESWPPPSKETISAVFSLPEAEEENPLIHTTFLPPLQNLCKLYGKYDLISSYAKLSTKINC